MEIKDVLKEFSPRKIIIPILIGLSVAVFMVWREYNSNPILFKNFVWTNKIALGILLACSMTILKDFFYMVRIRILTDHKINWKRSFGIIMLWEFSSAITPSVVGGTAFAVFFLNKEGLTIGKSTAIALLSAFLDELFFIIITPIFILLLGLDVLFVKELNSFDFFGLTINPKIGFYISFIIIAIYTILIGWGLLINPKPFKNFITKIFNMPLLRRWKTKAVVEINNIELASHEMQNKTKSFWIKAFGATALSWTCRYLLINMLVFGFNDGTVVNGIYEHFVVYGRQITMWIIMLISPTPGGSGIAEFAFDVFLKDFFPAGLSGILSVLWRFVSYYPYLIIGAIILPRWVQQYRQNKNNA